MTKGKCIVLSAPSGSGKTTLAKQLLQNKSLQLAFSISATSREPRANEKHGVDYFFISPDRFQKQIDQGDFIEYEEVYPGVFYGTLRAEVERLWHEGKHVIFDIDVEGGLQIKKQFPAQTITIFIKPPGLATLKDRLKNRETESSESLKMRLDKAENELKSAPKFEYIVHNNILSEAGAELEELVTQFIKL
ncbi:MAG: guanylate kinase [Flavobacteriaceae bacterium]|nr:guanylate kinase [Flavobacteriaceae bacterium]